MRINQVESDDGMFLISKITKVQIGYKIAFARYNFRGQKRSFNDVIIVKASRLTDVYDKNPETVKKGQSVFGVRLIDQYVKGNQGYIIVSSSGDDLVKLYLYDGTSLFADVLATSMNENYFSKWK